MLKQIIIQNINKNRTLNLLHYNNRLLHNIIVLHLIELEFLIYLGNNPYVSLINQPYLFYTHLIPELQEYHSRKFSKSYIHSNRTIWKKKKKKTHRNPKTPPVHPPKRWSTPPLPPAFEGPNRQTSKALQQISIANYQTHHCNLSQLLSLTISNLCTIYTDI